MQEVDMQKKVSWDSAETKKIIHCQTDKYIGKAADASRESTKTGLRTVIPSVLNALMTLLKMPLSATKAVNEFYSKRIIEKCDPILDDCADSSSKFAKKTFSTITDKFVDSADCSYRFFSWLF